MNGFKPLFYVNLAVNSCGYIRNVVFSLLKLSLFQLLNFILFCVIHQSGWVGRKSRIFCYPVNV
jgi:hypothetical protein